MSGAFPFSPAPSSPSYSDASSPRPDERRRSKRDSASSQTRQREEAAARYPSPPVGTRSRPQSIEASLQIPPYNPNRRGAPPSPSPSAPSRTRSDTSSTFDGDRLGGLMPAPRISAPHQTTHRSASAAVIPVASPIPSHVSGTSASSRVRQSVGYLPAQSTADGAGPHPQLYTPHPMPRQKIFFGPYILLQTLGEGEFGKVKLGIHSERWGEEVAIKLIKRGNVDTAQRGEKVRREIEVLKAVRHPNIVRLYDVIETEKYIGIVLEYASGGELFDHILAHRYLKERDAARLFAQLISGVAYLHAKGIVHRDLKLENLLLDRNRNVVVTDFGFANRFDDAGSDLMATSCGSPCYAAPELVVQEGKYVGTAVDVWSCGVILYAMLAGYLPYDDDPANPEGDNINLLYKYIIHTPLSFPDWISAEPRELLLQMLVPDPAYRCTIEDVTRHSWLRKYASTFNKSVHELEMQAQDAEMAKRQALEAQRLFLVQQQQQQAAAAAGGMTAAQAQAMVRSQSSTPSSASRHRSAIVTSATQYTMELPPSVPEESNASRAAVILPYPQNPSRRASLVPPSPTLQSHPVTVDADPFSYEPRASVVPSPSSSQILSSPSAPLDAPVRMDDEVMRENERPSESKRRAEESASSSSGGRSRRSSTRSSKGASASGGSNDAERRKKSHRATVQVEYDGGSMPPPQSRSRSKAAPVAVPPSPSLVSEDVFMAPVDPPSPQVPEPANTAPLDEPSLDIDERSASQPPFIAEIPAFKPHTPPYKPPTPPAEAVPFPSTPPRSPSSSALNTPRKRKNTGSPSDAVPSDLPAPPLPTPSAETTPKAKKTSAASHPSFNDAPPPRPESAASSTAIKHKKAGSIDRFSIRSLLSGSSTSLEKGPTRPTTSSTDRAKAAEAKRQADAVAKEEAASTRRNSRRQKALSLQPFRSGTSAKLTKAAKQDVPVPARDGARTRSSTVTTAAKPAGSTASQNSRPPSSFRMPTHASTTKGSSDVEATWSSRESGSSSSSGKAKAVMDWFRRRSTRGYPGAEAIQAPIPTDFDRFRPASVTLSSDPVPSPAPAPTSTTMSKEPSSISTAPSVVVTAARTPPIEEARYPTNFAESQPSSRSASGAQSHLSHMTTSTTATTASSVHSPSTQALVAAFTESKLRVHGGALDKSAITSRSPPVVMGEIKNVLWQMGVDAVQEGDYKLKGVRKSRKKALATSGPMLLSGSSHSTASTNATSGPLDRRTGLPSSASIASNLTASPSTSGFRSFFRKNSSTPLGSPLLGPTSPDAYDSPLVPSISQFGVTQPQPAYGDVGTSDAGDEVRFYVELTRVKNLEGLYCVDLRRIRGGQWSYKFVYERLLEALELGSS